MNRISILTLLTALSIGMAAHSAQEQKAESTEQTHCPVMQRYPVDKSLYIDVKGKRVYVCCKGCINQVKANPDKYIKRLEDKGILLEKAPARKEKTPEKSCPAS